MDNDKVLRNVCDGIEDHEKRWIVSVAMCCLIDQIGVNEEEIVRMYGTEFMRIMKKFEN